MFVKLLSLNMATKTHFDNEFEDFNTNFSSKLQFINSSGHGISDEFFNKLQTYMTKKLRYLTTKLHEDIFYDTTVYTGSAGLAYFYLNSAQEKEGKSIEMMQEALKYIELKHLKGKRITFLCGDAGPLAIATVISYKLGATSPKSLPDYKTLVERLMALIGLLDDSPDEILYGKSGYLYALLFVNKHTDGKLIPVNHIEKVVSAILKSGKQFSAKKKSSSPLLWQWHDKVYLGAAHGIAGILYMLLQAKLCINSTDMDNFIRPSIDWLMEQRFPSHNFPSSVGSGSGDRLVQWCHGAPGFVPLCLLAYKTFEDQRYLNIALESGEVIWQRGLCTKGYSICHGVGGNAYAFIQLYQATKDPMQLYRACRFTEWVINEAAGTEQHRPDRPASLFEGLAGRLYLAKDMTQINDAKFPALTL